MVIAAAGPQQIVIGDLFLKIVATTIPDNVLTDFFGDEPDEVLYPNALGYVRWVLEVDGGDGPPSGNYALVVTTFNSSLGGPEDLTQTPWWNDETLARQVAASIGTPDGNGQVEFGNPNGGFFGPWLAYGVDGNGSIQVVTYEGTSGNLTGNTVQSPDNSLVYLYELPSPPAPDIVLNGPWFPIFQKDTTIPISYSGSNNLAFEVVERLGVTITGEFISV